MSDEKINDDYIQRQENLWIIHCENLLRKGKIPKRWDDLPPYIKTERMRKYYVELRKRLEP
ncbi:hypothetical protein [Leptospira ainazelensis]|uniref:hypothetical protein n=1 Tax=Leptospira ainazelensis TaxID=2810034 RepID=UPI001E5D9A05|nr:hypothetical protein [Leptospira ainazelensis]